MARKMVCSGAAGRAGAADLPADEEHIFLGAQVARAKDYSEETALAIERRDQAHRRGLRNAGPEIIEENIEKLHALARGPPGARVARLRGIARILRAQTVPGSARDRLGRDPRRGRGARR